jgi:hypothetical protein
MVTARRHLAERDRLETLSHVLGASAAAGVVVPGLTFLGTRLVLLCIALSCTLRGLPSPASGEEMLTSPGWPPFIVPSAPFWVSLPPLLGLAVVTIWRPRQLADTYRSGFVAMYLGLAGMWSVLFALSFWETPAWPRDSLIPGVIELVACAVVAVVAVGRLVRDIVRRVRGRAPSEDVPGSVDVQEAPL